MRAVMFPSSLPRTDIIFFAQVTI